MKLYLETTVPNFLFHDDAPEKQAVTKDFFAWLHVCPDELFTSRVAVEEIQRTAGPKRQRMLDALNDLPLTVLDTTPEALGLARVYVLRGVVPERFFNDALQIAIAVCHSIDVVVTWNMQHMAKVRKIEQINHINLEYGLPAVRIHTPEEVLDS